ncbi:MAG: ATP-binding cassette domain-containing protein, partial [Acidobacteriota bacterium]
MRTLTLRYGGDAPLLDGVGFYVQRGERIGLLGRNGTGKSSLLKILSGDVKPDGGEVVLQAGTRVARLAQEVPRDLRGDVFDVVAGGLPELGSLLSDYHHWSSRLAQGDGSEADLARLEDVQHRLEGAGGWDLHRRVESTLSRLGLPAEGRFETLSGGMSRRVLLARTLLSEPDLLLLDEPTNHLDIPAIEWLEEMLRSFQGAILFVTHDRAFLRGLATRILEIDRGRIDDFPGDYPRYLERRQAQMEAELAQHDRFDKKLAQEEAWIRQGIKARRTRNEGRVRALEKLREERRARRVGKGQARFAIEGAERSGKRVIETEGLTFSWAGRPMVKGLSTTICRGDKVGLLGPNGSGKTTLLRLLLGELEPEAGTVEHGTRLEVAYFDQLREQLDEDQSVADSVANGADQVEVGGRRRHVISYLQD